MAAPNEEAEIFRSLRSMTYDPKKPPIQKNKSTAKKPPGTIWNQSFVISPFPRKIVLIFSIPHEDSARSSVCPKITCNPEKRTLQPASHAAVPAELTERRGSTPTSLRRSGGHR